MITEKIPLVSVVMSCYNSEKYIDVAIKSLVTQKYTNWELIIVDDFSTDNSIKIIEKCIKKFKISDKVKIIKHSTNYGCGTSLSDAILNSKGPLVAILDSDDALDSELALQMMVKIHLKHPNASLTYSNYWECSERLKKLKIFKTRQIVGKETYLGSKIRISHFKVFKREFYNKTVGVNRTLRQTVDKDLVLKLEEVGKLIHVNETLYLYRQRKSNLTKSTNRKPKNYKEFVKIMRYKVYNDARKRRGLPLKNITEIKEWEKNNPTYG